MPEKIEYKGDEIMEKYSYVIIGIIALVFRIFRKSLQKKKEAEMELLIKQQQTQEPKSVQTKKEENVFSTDFLENFNKHFEEDEEDDYIPKNITNKQKYQTSEIQDFTQRDDEKEEEIKEQIENYNLDNKLIIKPKDITKNNVTINLKQAIIYKTILERKY